MPETIEPDFTALNAGKADFNAIYDQADPRAYFAVLGALNYIIPDVARPVFDQIIGHLIKRLGRPLTVLDLGCSYGVNAAILKHGLGTDALRARYADPRLSRCSTSELAAFDQHYFASWPKRHDLKIIGLDVSRPATDYALRVGLLDDVITTDLETEALSAGDARKLSSVDLVISTGCIGYITERTFKRILDVLDDRAHPWVASFVLRMFPFDAIDAALTTKGLVTEKLSGATFVQRRFRDADEAKATHAALRALGIDTRGKESDGLYHAEFFLSRPEVDVCEAPLNDLISIASGAGRLIGWPPRIVGRETHNAAA
jgi:SAM-dependent methyltransferase